MLFSRALIVFLAVAFQSLYVSGFKIEASVQLKTKIPEFEGEVKQAALKAEKMAKDIIEQNKSKHPAAGLEQLLSDEVKVALLVIENGQIGPSKRQGFDFSVPMSKSDFTNQVDANAKAILKHIAAFSGNAKQRKGQWKEFAIIANPTSTAKALRRRSIVGRGASSGSLLARAQLVGNEDMGN
ncbi:hypothetical protein BJ165DRAFT_1501534 [Panaeolus papilionaceus]|nr:hypothetical protein BJ165DRAFT_1501534 [Panaeolus papilionaceus]